MIQSPTPAQSSASQKISAAYQKLSQTYLKRNPDDNMKFGIVVFGVLLLSLISYLSLAYSWPKFSRAEVFFAECVREMFLADNPVTPLYHGTPFFDKPILSYWTIAASYLAFGISHFSARIPSVLCALGTIFMTALAGKHLFGPRSGTLAAAVLASSVMFMSFANLCMSDMTLVFFDTLSMGLLYYSLENEKRRSILLYMGSMSMGLAFLTKGPVGIALPALAFATYLSISQQWNKIKFFNHVLPCSLIMALAGVPWFMAAYRQNGAGALSYFFIHENVERFAGSTYDTHRPIWFMVVSLFGGMLPWSIFLPMAFKDSFKQMKAGMQNITARKHFYLWLWIATVIGFFSVSRGKIDYYALPVYPAAAILVGHYLSTGCDMKTKLTKISSWIIASATTIAGIAITVLCARSLPEMSPESWIAMPAVLILCGGIMLRLCVQQELRQVFKMLFVTFCLCSIAVSAQIYPWINSKQAVLKFIPAVKMLRENDRIGVYTTLQNWIDEITFQANVEPMRIDSVKMAEQFLRSRTKSMLMIPEQEYLQMSQETRDNCRIIATKPFIPRSINPVYFLSKGKNLGETKLVLVINKPKLLPLER